MMFEKVVPYTRSTRDRNNDQVMSLLEYNIVKLNLVPGEMISETEICKQIGCSRTPVHNAFLILSYKNLLEIIPQVGTRIQYFNEELINSVCFIRNLLEMDNLRLLADRKPSADIISRLRYCLEIQDKGVAEKDYWTLFEVDNEIHELMFVATGRMMSYKIIQEQLINFNRVRTLIYKNRDLDRIVNEHKALISAYISNDIDEMRSILEHHISLDLISADVSALRKEYPDYFM